MSLSTFELEVLGHVANDYETAETILSDIARDLGRAVEEQEVTSALYKLSRSGLVDAFVFDASSSRYLRTDVETSSVSQLWFLANKDGVSEYERSAG